MAWSGGTFTRIGGVTHWVDDKNAAINIVASRHDTNDEDISTGINQCLTRDNQAKPTSSFLPNADNSLDLGALATRWRNLFAVTGQFGDGLVGTPAWTFGLDTDTGGYRIGANDIGFAVGGALGFEITTGLAAARGTVALDLSAVSTTTTTGQFTRLLVQAGANSVALIQANQNEVGTVVTSGPTGPQSVLRTLGSYPLVFGTGNTYAGQITANRAWSIPAANADISLAITGAANQYCLQLAANGTASQSFGLNIMSGTNTSDSALRVTSQGGTPFLLVRGDGQFEGFDGSAAIPGMSFLNDTDTGLYRDTANQIAIALGGVTAGQIAQGTFTLTGTGFTAGVTATVRYQRVGNHVMLNSDGFSGTSNATTFTGTGLPAIIQVANATGPLAIAACADNGAIVSDVSALITAASGTITFQRAAGASAFTAANSKGWALGFTLSYKV